ncbi:cytochrome P450 [Cucurbitaria berberidis CBS 394.84]|uniref:Cytochrome P450 n=1 Tax=Cucurbitaria berberidis CBS 394.84 TaxID=1168544 RepID=A0A9P4GPM5_9PLEO|nr:cytochrome P450 [Cucurbitaria berberidis CBS 394.84]KAF1849405.1 cytochrome P450 [Cucurbitaria berberidis CBS 394.84]
MLLAIATLIIVPFLTFFLSTTLFYRKTKNKFPGQTPPTTPYFVPGVFHAFSLAYFGPQKYFAALIDQYGNFAPFVVKAGLGSFLVLRDPKQAERVLQASNQLTTRKSNLHIHERLFGSPKEILKFYAGKGSNGNEAGLVELVHSALPRKYLMGTSLAPLIDTYVSILSRNLNEKMFQVGFWTQIEDFWSFLQQVIARCTIETLFGREIIKQYPSIVKDYLTFADAAASFVPGMPRFLASATYEGPRDRLHEGIAKWLKATHSGSEFAKIDEEDPVWDEDKGSKFIQERDDVFAKTEGVDLKGRAAEVLSVMHGSNSSLLPSAFWTLVEVLRKPQLGKHIAAEISQHYSPQAGEYDVASITETPFIQSVQTEVRRLRVPTVATRTNEVDNFQLDEQWTLPRGMTVMLFSHDISLHTKFWAKARPRTVERPLEEFWAERFLLPNRATSSAKSSKPAKDKIEAGNFSMEGLESLDLVLGGNDDQCLGRDYMRAVHAATLAVFLNEFDLQLCDTDEVDAAIPPVREDAYGTVKPLYPVAVRIRKRRMG